MAASPLSIVVGPRGNRSTPGGGLRRFPTRTQESRARCVAAFYWAEAGANPRVTTYWDALHYVTTALSVGYANIFPVTPIGKVIGALVMTVGPALSARALDHAPRAMGGESDGAAVALLGAKLDAILAELRRARGA